MTTLRLALALLALGLVPGEARAGFRTTAWSFDTRTVPERQAELEVWITQLVQGPDGGAGTTSLLLSPVIGLTDQIELAVPVTADYARATDQTQLSSWGLDARWRLVSSDPAKAGKIVPLIRAGVRRLVANDKAFKLQGDAVVSIEPTPRLHIVINAGVYFVTDVNVVTAEYSGGALYAITRDLRLGVDAFANHELRGPGEHDAWFAAGPAITLSHGRFWVAASVPFGITAKAPDAMPRLIWALAF